MLVRYLLEKCKNTDEVLFFKKKIPVASCQTLTIANRNFNIAVVECNCEKIEIIRPTKEENFVTTTNMFHLHKMRKFNRGKIDDWKAKERYFVSYNTLKNIKTNIP